MSLREKLLSYGSLSTEPDLSRDGELLRDPYDWMRKQIARRLPGCEGRHPWWAYLPPKPHLTWTGGSLFPEGGGVRLELQMARDRVLVSDCRTWHLVFGHHHVPLMAEEGQEWESRVPAEHRDVWPAPER